MNQVWILPDFLHQRFGVVNTTNLTIVVNANKQCAALRIGKAADVLQIFVFPLLLEFYVLTFRHLALSDFTLQK